MRLAHLSLAVAGQQRSRRFYEAYLACYDQPDREGCLHLTDPVGFDLALVPQQPDPPPASFTSESR